MQKGAVGKARKSKPRPDDPEVGPRRGEAAKTFGAKTPIRIEENEDNEEKVAPLERQGRKIPWGDADGSFGPQNSGMNSQSKTREKKELNRKERRGRERTTGNGY